MESVPPVKQLLRPSKRPEISGVSTLCNLLCSTATRRRRAPSVAPREWTRGGGRCSGDMVLSPGAAAKARQNLWHQTTGEFSQVVGHLLSGGREGGKKVGRWICCLPLGLGGEWAPSQHQTLVSLGFWVFRLKSLWQMSFKVSEFAFNPAL